MTKQSTKQQSKSVDEGKVVLYVGTTERIAKETPLRGIESPTVLSDVYPGYFAFFASQSEKQRWGIIEVSIEALLPDNLIAWKGNSWQESLKQYGACSYLLHIPPIAISKVMIYNPWVGGNRFVNEIIEGTNRSAITPARHKANYALNRGLTRWLAGEAVSGEELLNGDSENIRKAIKLDQFLHNRSGLDLFYLRTKNTFHSWWKAEGI